MPAKLNYLLPAFLIVLFLGCKTNQSRVAALPTAGLFKVAVLYPNGEGKTFDMDYYQKKHMPMVASLLGNNLKFYEIDKGIAGRSPKDQIPFLAVGYFYISDVAEYSRTISQNREAIISDFKNYTNIQPNILISEITQVTHNNTK